jgi:MerR family transcriptional regulator, heat shock protein HspR
MDDHPRYSISVAAELTGLHPQTLRMYEARGLVRPRRTPGGTRRYSDRDVERLRRITSLTTEYGMNLSGALAVLELEERVAQLTSQVGHLQAQLLEAARRSAADVAEVHRSYRRELVLYEPPKPPTTRITRYRWTSPS